MSESGAAREKEAATDRNRYQLLLEVTDRVARTRSLPDALKELARPVLALTGGELLNLSVYDPRRNRMLSRYWKKNQESGSGKPVHQPAEPEAV